MILRRSIVQCFTGRLFVARQSTTTRSQSVTFDQVKKLYDQKRYDQLLQLFDGQVKHGLTERLSAQAIVKFVQSAAQLQDLTRAAAIHRAIPSRLTNNPYVASSLVHMYSEYDQMRADQFSDVMLKCNVVIQRWLNSCLKDVQRNRCICMVR